MQLLREILEPGRPMHPDAVDETWARLQARTISADDEGFLRSLYAATRADEMSATGWPASRCRAFLDQQFEFQQRYYRSHHADALFLLLAFEGQPLGRLYWRSEPTRATLIDLSLSASWRGRGLGSTVLRWLGEVADRRGQAIELHVEPESPAVRLYRRFGFETELEADDNVYLRMRRPARGAA